MDRQPTDEAHPTPADVEEFAAQMREDWDARAECNAAFFVDYCNWRDEDEIEAAGRREVEVLLHGLDTETLRHAQVLEIGCGIARLIRPLAGRVRHAVGVDVSARMLGIARERTRGVANVELSQCDGTGALDFPDATFDGIYSGYVFEHMPAVFTWRYLAESARVLRPGGWLRFQFTVPLRPEVGPPPASDDELAAAAAEIHRASPPGVEALLTGPTIEGETIDLPVMEQRLAELGFDVERSVPTGANNVAVFAVRR